MNIDRIDDDQKIRVCQLFSVCSNVEKVFLGQNCSALSGTRQVESHVPRGPSFVRMKSAESQDNLGFGKCPDLP